VQARSARSNPASLPFFDDNARMLILLP
jgi:hypothetical protein